MNFKSCTCLVVKLLFVTLNLPFLAGGLLVAVMGIDSFFGYLNGTCAGVNGCLVVRVFYEMQQPKFWRLILAMWACNFFVVVIAIFFNWRKK